MGDFYPARVMIHHTKRNIFEMTNGHTWKRNIFSSDKFICKIFNYGLQQAH